MARRDTIKAIIMLIIKIMKMVFSLPDSLFSNSLFIAGILK